MKIAMLWWPLGLATLCPLAAAQEIPTVGGWRTAIPTPGTHRVGIDLSDPRGGKGAGKIAAIDSGREMLKGARACFMQEFYGKTAIRPGVSYRYRFSYRTEAPLEGWGQLLIDSYTKEGEKGRRTLVSEKLAAAGQWQTVSAEVAVPADAVRVRMLLYLHGRGTIWFDDAFFGDSSPDARNLLANGGFEPPACHVFDLAPEKPSGAVKFYADFPNATLGPVKQLGPDEYYLYAMPQDRPHSPFLWFHFRVEGCEGRALTFHVNPAPFSKDSTSGNGTRLPVMSEDGEHWVGIEEKSWNEDGTALSFKQRFTKPTAWVASFFPYTADRVRRFIESHKNAPCFQASVVGKTQGGRDIDLYTITDPDVPEAGKRVVLFTALQHDLETTGALALEGLSGFLLSDDPRARQIRRSTVFYIVPRTNPDGIDQGNLYCPAGNLNRQWGLGTTAETTSVEKFVKGLAARGRKVDLFMDFHGWCHTERTTVFMTFGREIADEASERDALRLAEAIKPRLTGKTPISVWRKRLTTVTGITGDLNRLSCGWMKFEAGARLAYSIEIFGEGDCTQEGYLAWGRAFAEGIAEFYSQ